jgi:hypothetical protein
LEGAALIKKGILHREKKDRAMRDFFTLSEVEASHIGLSTTRQQMLGWLVYLVMQQRGPRIY